MHQHHSDPATNIIHPFHIHVNSFVVTKVHDPTNPDQNMIDTSPMLWQDTILLPPAKSKIDTCEDAGYIVIRHRFTDFTGQFVLHCHNLIHEDFGMMQVVQIVETEQDCPPGTRWQDHQQCKSGVGLPPVAPAPRLVNRTY